MFDNWIMAKISHFESKSLNTTLSTTFAGHLFDIIYVKKIGIILLCLFKVYELCDKELIIKFSDRLFYGEGVGGDHHRYISN